MPASAFASHGGLSTPARCACHFWAKAVEHRVQLDTRVIGSGWVDLARPLPVIPSVLAQSDKTGQPGGTVRIRVEFSSPASFVWSIADQLRGPTHGLATPAHLLRAPAVPIRTLASSEDKLMVGSGGIGRRM